MSSIDQNKTGIHSFLFKKDRVMLAAEYRTGYLQKYLNDLDGLFDSEGSRIIKDFGSTKTAVISIDLGKGRESFVLKRFSPESMLGLIFRRFTQSRSSRVWSMSWKLLSYEIPVPKPVAMIEEKRSGLVGKSYFLSDFAQDAVNFKAHSVRSGTGILNDGRLLERMGKLIGRLHRSGFIHGDLKWSNFLIQDIEGGQNPMIVDLDHVKYHRHLSTSRRVKDLSRFVVDAYESGLDQRLTDQFLTAYFKSTMIPDDQRKVFQKQMEPVVEKIIKRHRKKEL